MIVVESNSRQFPTESWVKTDETVVTVKRPTLNTDYLAGRHISLRRSYHPYPFLCYKWNPHIGARGGKFDHIDRENIYQADWKYWDKYFRSFNPKHPDPSSGTCAIYSVMEFWKPDTIGLIGFDYVLDNKTDWIHDAKAELQSIKRIVNIIDLRRQEVNRSKVCQP